MFNEHLKRATSRSSKPPIVRAYDGSALRPDLSSATTYHDQESITQLTLNTQKMNETTQNQMVQIRDQMSQGFKTLNESLLVFSEKVASQFQHMNERLEKLEYAAGKTLPPPAQHTNNVPHQQNTSQNSSMYGNATPASNGPSQFHLQQFHQLLGAQIAKYVRDFKPQALYDHFFSLGQLVVEYFNDVQTLSRVFGMDLSQYEVTEAYGIVYDRIGQDVLGFAQQVQSNTNCIIPEPVNVNLLENSFKQVFRQTPKLGQSYSFTHIYTAFCIVLVLRFQANLLRFAEISGTLAEFQARYGIECSKEPERRCQVILPQWIGKAQIAAYVKLLR